VAARDGSVGSSRAGRPPERPMGDQGHVSVREPVGTGARLHRPM